MEQFEYIQVQYKEIKDIIPIEKHGNFDSFIKSGKNYVFKVMSNSFILKYLKRYIFKFF